MGHAMNFRSRNPRIVRLPFAEKNIVYVPLVGFKGNQTYSWKCVDIFAKT